MKKVLVLAILAAATATWATPIVVTNANLSIYSSTPDPAWPNSAAGGGNGSDIYVMADPMSAYNAMGTAGIAINQAIPDGEYEVSIRYCTGAVHDPGAGGFAVSMSVIGSGGTYVENGNPGPQQYGFKTYYPSNVYVGQQVWYDTKFASAQGSAGWFAPVWTGSPLPTSITVSGIDGSNAKLELLIMDNISANYDYAQINSITFTPVPEPMTMSLLALGGLALIRRK